MCIGIRRLCGRLEPEETIREIDSGYLRFIRPKLCGMWGNSAKRTGHRVCTDCIRSSVAHDQCHAANVVDFREIWRGAAREQENKPAVRCLLCVHQRTADA